MVGMRAASGSRYENVDILADQLRAFISEETAGHGVSRAHDPVMVNDQDAIGRGLEDRSVLICDHPSRCSSRERNPYRSRGADPTTGAIRPRQTPTERRP